MPPEPPPATLAPSPAPATPTPDPTPSPDLGACDRLPLAERVSGAIGRIDPDRLHLHMETLASFGSRDPRHPGHARAVAYLKGQLGSIAGVRLESQLAAHQGVPLENVFAVIDGPGARADGWVVIAAHYDSIAVRTPGWRPAVDPAPGADDNATGTAALLEYARVLADQQRCLQRRVVLAFFDGEELFFKGSAAWLQTLERPYPIAAVVNIDMVGFNPVADRLDLIRYGSGSDGLRDRVKAAAARYAIEVTLVDVHATDPSQYILDTAPFGLAGIPSVTLTERYGPPDGLYPGNTFFHTTADTPDRVTNRALWLKAARLTLATALELAFSD